MSCKEAEPPNLFWLYGPVVKTHVECDSIVFGRYRFIRWRLSHPDRAEDRSLINIGARI